MNYHKDDRLIDTEVMQERYQQAQLFMEGFATTSLVQNETIFPHWLVDANNKSIDMFWYERAFQKGKEFRLVDVKAATNNVAFDHASLAQALAQVVEKDVDANDLPISHMTLSMQPHTVAFTAFNQRWEYSAATKHCQRMGEAAVNEEVCSPDRRQVAFTRNYNLWVRDVATGKERALTVDGIEDFDYAEKGLAWGGRSSLVPCQPALWSPDSNYLLTVKRDRRNVLSLPHVTHMPNDGSVRPQLDKTKVAYTGDQVVETYQTLAINVKTGAICFADYRAMPAALNEYFEFFLAKLAFWAKDSRRAFFIEQTRGDRELCMVEFDALTGKTKVLFEETSATHIDLRPDGSSLPLHYHLQETDELIWHSERSGWAHFYLYDLSTGTLKRTITQGDWRVRDLLWVDEKKRELFIQTSGRVEGRDPYYRDICRVNIDSGELLTVCSSDHEYIVSYQECVAVVANKISGRVTASATGISPDGKYLVATRTRADQVPVSLLIDREGATLLEVEKANFTALPNNWQWPEPVKLLAADGVTDIYGLVFRPSFFSPDQQYPVINFINSAPWLSVVPKGSFHTTAYPDRHYLYSAAMAELGFIVVNIDSRGSPRRSKAFLDESYGWIPSSANSDDHVGAIQQLAEKYPYIDLSRVGICSQAYRSGLQNFMERQDFYKVCVNMALLDNRLIGCTIEGDKFEGVGGPNSDRYHYPEQLVGNLSGKLMLMQSINSDISVAYPPAGTFRVIEALQKANKKFDMLIVPNGGFLCTSYMFRRSWDYLVTHLLGATPPKEFSPADVSMGK